MRKNFPGGVEKQRGWRMEDGGWPAGSDFELLISYFAKPGFQVLLKIFLRFQIRRDDDDGPMGKDLSEQCGDQWLGGRANTGAGQHSAMLQSPGEGLHGGSFRDVSEQLACR